MARRSIPTSAANEPALSSSGIDTELLAPSLSADDDLQGFHEPWNPSQLSFAAFFLGPFGSAWLYFENFRRLGQRRDSTVWALLFVLVGGGGMVGAYWYNKQVGTGDARLLRTLARALTVVLALIASHRQRERWRLFQMGDQPPGRLWPALVLALAITFSMSLLLALLVNWLT